MIRYLIKNNIKLMFRNKWVIGLVILGPILVIAVLSSAFEDLMKSYQTEDNFSVGYRVEGDSIFADFAEQIKEAGEETGIVFTEYPEGMPEKLVNSNALAGFVDFGKEDYTVYKSAHYKAEGAALEYFISRVMSRMSEGMGGGTSGWENEDFPGELPVKELSFMPAIDSMDYYGIVYVVYFMWCGIVCISGVLSGEKKNGISRKFQVAPLSVTELFLSRWISCTVILAGGITVTVLFCIWAFGVTWGNICGSILILFLGILAANAFGLFVFYLLDNLAITVGTVFTAVFFMGFVGGSFETYMFSSTPEWIKRLSPIYYIDRTLVEYSCMGESSYTGDCIIFLLTITAVCVAGAVLIDSIRRRGRV